MPYIRCTACYSKTQMSLKLPRPPALPSPACITRIHRHSFSVHMMSGREDKKSPNSLTSYNSQPSLSSPLLISCLQHVCVWVEDAYCRVYSRPRRNSSKFSSPFIQGLFPADWQECVSCLLVFCLAIIYTSSGELHAPFTFDKRAGKYRTGYSYIELPLAWFAFLRACS